MYEEDFQEERKDRAKAHGMLDELKGKLSHEKSVFETQLQECHTTIAKMQSQERQLSNENERLQRDLQEYSIGKVSTIPHDSNLVCPACGKKFTHGDIQ